MKTHLPRQDDEPARKRRKERSSLPPAVILDGDVNAVSLARSLAGMGVKVFAVNKSDAPVRYSRFAHWIPTPSDGTSGLVDFLTGADSEYLRGAVLLAAGDAVLQILATHRETLAEKFLLDESNPRAQLCMLNKLCTYQAAVQAGVPTPGFWIAKDRDELNSLRDSLVYPLIVKPQLGHLFLQKFGEKFLVVHDFDQLVEAMSIVEDAGVEVLLVEQLPCGDETSLSYYTYLDEHGQPLFHFVRRGVRRHPPGKGFATCHMSSGLDDTVRELSLKLLRHVGLRGLANVEFLYDDRDDQFKLIECNARFTASNEMLVGSGIDLAQFVYRRVVGLPEKPITTYKTGVSLWHPIEDVRSFLALRRQGKLCFREWLASVLRPHVLPLFCWHDPFPSVMHLVGRFRRLGAAAGSRLRRRNAARSTVQQRAGVVPPQQAVIEGPAVQPRLEAETSVRHVDADDLRDFATALFVAAGLSIEEADIIAKSLVEANLRGYDSHGVMRIPSYIDKIRNREVVPGAAFKVTKDLPSLLMADGNWGFGQVQCKRLTEQLIAKCKSAGIAIGTLRQTTHVGRLGEYCEMAADAGLVAMAMVNTHGTSKWVAPPGGAAARLGTNPIAFGIPDRDAPLLLDFSTSATSEGKVRIHSFSQESCPPGWLLDSAGRPTGDAGVLYRDPRGTILPMGGDQPYKGFGLGLMAEVFAGALSEGVCSQEVPRNPKGNCVFMQLIDPELFCGATQFDDQVSDLLEFVRSCPRADGVEEISLPGDRARRAYEVRSVDGIPFDERNWEKLAELANELGVLAAKSLTARSPPMTVPAATVHAGAAGDESVAQR